MQLELIIQNQGDIEERQFDATLSQWMTPSWAAQAIVEKFFSEYDGIKTVLEPSCGTGNILTHIPENIRAIGVEIDPKLAKIARDETLREIITGDFRYVDLPTEKVDAIIGNPPFSLGIFDGFIDRSYALMDYGSPVVMILPSFAFQTSSRVVRYNQRWTLKQEMLPRNLFPNIKLPLMLATFIKDKNPKLHGFLLYNESREIEEMAKVYQRALREGRSGWKAVVEEALKRLGGEASLEQVYAEIAPKRPTATSHWKAKIRQQLRQHFPRKSKALYSLAA